MFAVNDHKAFFDDGIDSTCWVISGAEAVE